MICRFKTLACGASLLAIASMPMFAQQPAGAEQQVPGAQASVRLEDDYVLQPGDVIDVKFFYNPDLNETLPVRPDGRVSLQLVNDVPAGGRTPTELRTDLIGRYTPVLRQPELAVIVKQVAPRRLYIGGEVRTPSLLRVDGPITLMQAIIEAGGFTRAGKRSDIVVLRYNGKPVPEFMKIDLTATLNKGAAGDIPLRPLDIVWVPKTTVAKIDDFMAQYVRELLPLPLQLGVTYLLGGSAVLP